MLLEQIHGRVNLQAHACIAATQRAWNVFQIQSKMYRAEQRNESQDAKHKEARLHVRAGSRARIPGAGGRVEGRVARAHERARGC